MTDVLTLSATEAAAAVARREVTARALTERVLDRISETNPALNAVVELRSQAALTEADRADTAVRDGRPLGPLHGVPVTIKESFDVAGLSTTWGNPAFVDNRPAADSAVAARLRAAGAILVGKTNVAFMLSDNQSANPRYGVTNNPWDATRTPGGSSGGAAAALAANATFLDVGTDLSGSIRNPAAFCGVYGLRPTPGLVPLTGHAPPGPAGVPLGADHVVTAGPLARTAGDLRIALQTLGGLDNPALRWSLPAPRHRRLRDFRVGVVLDHPEVPISAAVRGVLSDTVAALARAGATVVPGWPHDAWDQFEEFGFQVEQFFALASAGTTSHREFIEHDNHRIGYRQAWARYFDNVDVFLCPVNTDVAFGHPDPACVARTVPSGDGELPYNLQFFWTAPAGLCGLPALAAPVGFADGLPVGIQVIGPRYEEDTILTFAELAFGPATSLLTR